MYKNVSAHKGRTLFEGLNLVKLNTSIQLQHSFMLGLKDTYSYPLVIRVNDPIGQVRLELRGLHSQDLFPCQQPLISEKESLLSTQGLVIPVHHIRVQSCYRRELLPSPLNT